MVDVEPELPTSLAPYPIGWYSVGFSEEFPRGAVVTRKLGGKEVLVARTASGTVTAMGPICPHLGALRRLRQRRRAGLRDLEEQAIRTPACARRGRRPDHQVPALGRAVLPGARGAPGSPRRGPRRVGRFVLTGPCRSCSGSWREVARAAHSSESTNCTVMGTPLKGPASAGMRFSSKIAFVTSTLILSLTAWSLATAASSGM